MQQQCDCTQSSSSEEGTHRSVHRGNCGTPPPAQTLPSRISTLTPCNDRITSEPTAFSQKKHFSRRANFSVRRRRFWYSAHPPYASLPIANWLTFVTEDTAFVISSAFECCRRGLRFRVLLHAVCLVLCMVRVQSMQRVSLL